MSLLTKIRENLKDALLARDEGRKSILRVVIGDVQTQEAKQKKEVSDTDIIKIVQRIIKSNEETMAVMDSANPSFAALKLENEILSVYLPKTMEEAEVRTLLEPLREDIKSAKATGAAMGVAMKVLKPTGKAIENSVVSKVIEEMRRTQ